jgi:hypothetical protein
MRQPADWAGRSNKHDLLGHAGKSLEVAGQSDPRLGISAVDRSGPRLLDSGLSGISTGHHAAAFATTLKYTASGVRRSSAA